MRRIALLSLATAMALPTAAAAHDHGAGRAAAEIADVADVLQDPAMQEELAATVTDVVDAVMDMPVGPLARIAAHIDPHSDLADVDPDATVADLAGRRGRRDVARLDDDVRHGTAMMGEMTAVMAAMLPAMAEMARDMEARWKERKHRD